MHALSEEMLFTETGSAVSTETLCKMVGAPGALGKDMLKYARESRVSVNADDNQDVLLAIVWVLPKGKPSTSIQIHALRVQTMDSRTTQIQCFRPWALQKRENA